MKIFENNAIKQLLVYVVSFFIIAALLLFLSAFENFKTQNSHKSLAHICGNYNESNFAKSKVTENAAKSSKPINQNQSSENFIKVHNETVVLGDFEEQLIGPKSKELEERNKRFILFNNGGVVKLVLGIAYPVTLADPVRSLSSFYNFHLQYMPPPIPLYPWSLYNTTTFPIYSKKKKRQANRDVSREIIYEAIKIFFERAGLPGEECLLQMICEISANPFHVKPNGNIFHELLNTIFIPIHLENVDLKYLNAFNAGHRGAVCDYSCSNEINWLKKHTILF